MVHKIKKFRESGELSILQSIPTFSVLQALSIKAQSELQLFKTDGEHWWGITLPTSTKLTKEEVVSKTKIHNFECVLQRGVGQCGQI